ncbi:hypothetical protein ACSSS7_006033 [Eimeria intestinalis]
MAPMLRELRNCGGGQRGDPAEGPKVPFDDHVAAPAAAADRRLPPSPPPPPPPGPLPAVVGGHSPVVGFHGAPVGPPRASSPRRPLLKAELRGPPPPPPTAVGPLGAPKKTQFLAPPHSSKGPHGGKRSEGPPTPSFSSRGRSPGGPTAPGGPSNNCGKEGWGASSQASAAPTEPGSTGAPSRSSSLGGEAELEIEDYADVEEDLSEGRGSQVLIQAEAELATSPPCSSCSSSKSSRSSSKSSRSSSRSSSDSSRRSRRRWRGAWSGPRSVCCRRGPRAVEAEEENPWGFVLFFSSAALHAASPRGVEEGGEGEEGGGSRSSNPKASGGPPAKQGLLSKLLHSTSKAGGGRRGYSSEGLSVEGGRGAGGVRKGKLSRSAESDAATKPGEARRAGAVPAKANAAARATGAARHEIKKRGRLSKEGPLTGAASAKQQQQQQQQQQEQEGQQESSTEGSDASPEAAEAAAVAAAAAAALAAGDGMSSNCKLSSSRKAKAGKAGLITSKAKASGNNALAGRLRIDPHVLQAFRDKQQQQQRALADLEKLYEMLGAREGANQAQAIGTELSGTQLGGRVQRQQQAHAREAARAEMEAMLQQHLQQQQQMGEVLAAAAASVKSAAERLQEAEAARQQEARDLTERLEKAEAARAAATQSSLQKLDEALVKAEDNRGERDREAAKRIETLQREVEFHKRREKELQMYLQEMVAFQEGPGCILLKSPPSRHESPSERGQSTPGDRTPRANDNNAHAAVPLQELLKVTDVVATLKPSEREAFLVGIERKIKKITDADIRRDVLKERVRCSLETAAATLKQQEEKIELLQQQQQRAVSTPSKVIQASAALDMGVESILRTSFCVAAAALRKVDAGGGGDEPPAAAVLLREELEKIQGTTEREKHRNLVDQTRSRVKDAKRAWREAAASVEAEVGELMALSERSTAPPSTLRSGLLSGSSRGLYEALRPPPFYEEDPTVEEVRDLLLSPILERRQLGLLLLRKMASKVLAQPEDSSRGSQRDKAERDAAVRILMHRLELLCNVPGDMGWSSKGDGASKPGGFVDQALAAFGAATATPAAAAAGDGSSPQAGKAGISVGREQHDASSSPPPPTAIGASSPLPFLGLGFGGWGGDKSSSPPAGMKPTIAVQPSAYEIKLLGNAVAAKSSMDSQRSSEGRGRGRDRGEGERDRRASSAGSAASFLSGVVSVSRDRRLPSAIVKDLLSFERKEKDKDTGGGDRDRDRDRVRGRSRDRGVRRRPNDGLNEVARREHGSRVEASLSLLEGKGGGSKQTKGLRTPGVWFQYADKEKQGFEKGAEGAKKGMAFLFPPSEKEGASRHQREGDRSGEVSAVPVRRRQSTAAIAAAAAATAATAAGRRGERQDSANRRASTSGVIGGGGGPQRGASSKRHSSEGLHRRRSSRRKQDSSTPSIPLVDPLSFKPKAPKKKLLDTPWATYGRPPPQKRERNLVRLPSEDQPENLDVVDKALDKIYKVIVGPPLPSDISDASGPPPSSSLLPASSVISSLPDSDRRASSETLQVIGDVRGRGAEPLHHRVGSQLQRQVLLEASQAFANTGRPKISRKAAGKRVEVGWGIPGPPSAAKGEGSKWGGPFGEQKGPQAAPPRSGKAFMKRGLVKQLASEDEDGWDRGRGKEAAKRKEAAAGDGGPPLKAGYSSFKAAGGGPLDLSKVKNKHASEKVPQLTPAELRELTSLDQEANTSDDDDDDDFTFGWGASQERAPPASSQLVGGPPPRGVRGSSTMSSKGPPPPPPSGDRGADKDRQDKSLPLPNLDVRGIPTEPPGGPLSKQTAGGPPDQEGDGAPAEREGESGEGEDGDVDGKNKEKKSWWKPLLDAPMVLGLEGWRGGPQGPPEGAPLPDEKDLPRTPKAAARLLKEAQDMQWEQAQKEAARNNQPDGDSVTQLQQELQQQQQQEEQQQQKLQENQKQQGQQQKQQRKQQEQLNTRLRPGGSPPKAPKGSSSKGAPKGPPPPPPPPHLRSGAPRVPKWGTPLMLPPPAQAKDGGFEAEAPQKVKLISNEAPFYEGPQESRLQEKLERDRGVPSVDKGGPPNWSFPPEAVKGQLDPSSPASTAEGPPPAQLNSGGPPPPPTTYWGAPATGVAGVPLVPLKGFPGAWGNFDGLWDLWLSREDRAGEVPPLPHADWGRGRGGPPYIQQGARQPALPASWQPGEANDFSYQQGRPPAPTVDAASREGPQGPPQTYTVRLRSGAGLAAAEGAAAAAGAAAAEQGVKGPFIYEVLQQGPTSAAAWEPPSSKRVYPPAEEYTGGAPSPDGGPLTRDPFNEAVTASQGFSQFWDLMQQHCPQQGPY